LLLSRILSPSYARDVARPIFGEGTRELFGGGRKERQRTNLGVAAPDFDGYVLVIM